MLSNDVLIELKNFVERHFVEEVVEEVIEFKLEEKIFSSKSVDFDELTMYIDNNYAPSFQETLFSYIDAKSLKDSEVYKKAGIDRRLFSKIRSNEDYKVSKNTAVSLALALNLNKKETDKLLSSAGYSLSQSNKFDLVIQFCVSNKIYNLNDVNEALHELNIKPLNV